jgi:lipoprotein-anchoring transpeptidase ErfK/SrfK
MRQTYDRVARVGGGVLAPAVLGGVLAVVAAAVTAPAAVAQGFLAEPGDDGVIFQEQRLEREYRSRTPLMQYDGRYVVVHLQENRVFVFDGGESVWSSPAGTGTGFVLDTLEHSWDFATPIGIMQVRRMERDPMWNAPAWHWLEKGLTPPPPGDARNVPGGMGNTAIYLGDGIAIHGTDKPHLVLDPDPEARRVSHGCIRLTDEAARELMHMVDVGTPVLIF